MEELAERGLRTLMFGIKELESTHTAESLKNAETEPLETGITFLGVTALEDLLQDNVAECI